MVLPREKGRCSANACRVESWYHLEAAFDVVLTMFGRVTYALAQSEGAAMRHPIRRPHLTTYLALPNATTWLLHCDPNLPQPRVPHLASQIALIIAADSIPRDRL